MTMTRPALALFAALAFAEEYTPGPDSRRQPGVPKGTVTKHEWTSKIFPGSARDYWIYAPAQYRKGKPAATMVFLDGGGFVNEAGAFKATVVMDNLIHKGEIPVMIGVFINPGAVAADGAGQARFTRSYEYDTIGPRFPDFLVKEILPEVAKSYDLSPDPNDRGISGSSSGGNGSFNAAWQRPDAFRRVLSFIGTFVHMRGADSLPAMIRRTEPKPLRVFLEAGKNDHVLPGHPFGTFYAGSWPINNQLMFEALQFAGYDVKLEYGENAHNMQHGAAILPDALRWLWRDYGKPIEPRPPMAMDLPGWDPRAQVYSVIQQGKPWEPIAGDFRSIAGIAADKDGRVFVADPAANRIWSVEGGKASVFVEKSGGATALRTAPDGRLYASQPAARRIVSYGPEGTAKPTVRDVVADDLAITASGAIYYLDAARQTIGVTGADGRKSVVHQGGFEAPSAIALSPDHSLLLVADAKSRFNWSFQIRPDGSLASGEPFYRVDMAEASTRGSAGVTADSIGQAYFATALGIQLCEQNGRCAAILAKPQPGDLERIAFGGPDLGWLHAAQGAKLFRRSVKTRGVDAPVKPPRPPL